MSELRIGISGWRYDGWRGEFYPDDLPQRRELEYAGRALNSLEINGTFYSMKSPETFDAWSASVPADFVFAVKGSRYITHTTRLRDPGAPLGNFFANGVLRLGRRLGPILWQLPPNMAWEPEVFKRFCAALPADMPEAKQVARRHDERVEGRMWFDTDERRTLRHAFEIRDERMMNGEMVRALRDHGHALVFADTAGEHPGAFDITAGFLYCRLHGHGEMYVGGYDDNALDWWKRRIERWSAGEQMKTDGRITDLKPPARKTRDVYVYFDNDVKVHAPFNAMTLAGKLGVGRDPHELKGDDGQPLPPPPRWA